MKKVIISVAVGMACAVGLNGQGTVNFSNLAGAIDSPVFDVDGTTALAGDGYSAQLWLIGGDGTPTPVATVEGGWFNGWFFGGTVAIDGVALSAPATLQVVAWDESTGATYADATIRGESNQITVAKTGGGGAPVPDPPANLDGLESFSLAVVGPGDTSPVVPEPSTVALGILGAAAFFLRRRK